MVTFDDIRDRYEQGEGSEEHIREAQRSVEEAHRKEREEYEAAQREERGRKIEKLKAKRAENEKALWGLSFGGGYNATWGIPEQVCMTWEHRARRLMEMEREIYHELMRDYESAMRARGRSRFAAYKKVENIFELLFDLFPTTQNRILVGAVSAGGLSYRRVDTDQGQKSDWHYFYELTRSGSSINFTAGYTDGTKNYLMVDGLDELCGIIQDTLQTRMAAEMITDGSSPIDILIAYKFHKYQKKLRDGVYHCSIEPAYSEYGEEDDHTLLKIDTGSGGWEDIVQLLNPENREEVKRFLIGNVPLRYVMTQPHEPYRGGKP